MKRLRTFAAATCVAATLGCGGGSDNPATYPVTGTVTQGGTAVEGATVTFIPPVTSAGTGEVELQSAVGVTDASGKYSLTTFESNDGAMPGAYKVRVFKFDKPEDFEAEPASSASGEMAEMPATYEPPDADGRAASKPKNQLPEKYNRVSQTPLEYTVTEGENTYDIELDAK